MKRILAILVIAGLASACGGTPSAYSQCVSNYKNTSNVLGVSGGDAAAACINYRR